MSVSHGRKAEYPRVLNSRSSTANKSTESSMKHVGRPSLSEFSFQNVASNEWLLPERDRATRPHSERRCKSPFCIFLQDLGQQNRSGRRNSKMADLCKLN